MDSLIIATILKKVIALALLIWVIYTFHSSAKRKGRSAVGWVMIGLLSFYGTYFVAAFGTLAIHILIASWRAGDFSNIDKQAIPGMVAASILYALPVAIASAIFVRRKLRALPEVAGGPQQQ